MTEDNVKIAALLVATKVVRILAPEVDAARRNFSQKDALLFRAELRRLMNVFMDSRDFDLNDKELFDMILGEPNVQQ